MAKLKAGKKGVFGGHEVVFADPDDEFWVGKKGYVVDEEEEEIEVDFDSMTVSELKQFVADYDLTINLDDYNPKAAKVEALEAYVEEHGLGPDPAAEDEVDED